jgi:hypothetical protein
MAPFDELQKLWQGQATPPPSINGRALARELRGFARRQRFVLIVKTVAVALILAFSAAANRSSLLVFAGLCLIGAAAGTLLAEEWRKQRRLVHPVYADPSLDFVRKSLDRVLSYCNPFRAYYRFFLVTALAGMNLICFGTAHGTPVRRVFVHAASSALLLGMYHGGLYIRRRRIGRDSTVRRLESLIASLENHSL